ncbi:SPAST1 [Auxenochlorella protothecoides x Auxenochlorella symbiontica]
MQWFTAPKKGTSSDSPPPGQPLSALAESRRRVEKLRGYHDLAQDAVDRAQRQDAAAAAAAPSIIFIDEIDSVLSARRGDEHDASRRLKTEFLSAFDGVASGGAHLLVLGATNRPWDLDEAVVRRLPKRIYVPLPGAEGRRALLEGMLRGQRADPGIPAVVAGLTEGYSGSDLAALCKEAAMAPIRELGRRVATVPANRIRGLTVADFREALQVIRPSLTPESMAQFEEWTARYGTAT